MTHGRQIGSECVTASRLKLLDEEVHVFADEFLRRVFIARAVRELSALKKYTVGQWPSTSLEEFLKNASRRACPKSLNLIQ
jgi:hypothetical protein